MTGPRSPHAMLRDIKMKEATARQRSLQTAPLKKLSTLKPPITTTREMVAEGDSGVETLDPARCVCGVCFGDSFSAYRRTYRWDVRYGIRCWSTDRSVLPARRGCLQLQLSGEGRGGEGQQVTPTSSSLSGSEFCLFLRSAYDQAGLLRTAQCLVCRLT